jgi:hypothetical protein
LAYDLVSSDSNLKLTRDWTSWLPSGVTIDTSTWSITPAGPTISGPTESGGKTTALVGGFTEGVVYRLTNKVEASNGEDDSFSWALRCEKR